MTITEPPGLTAEDIRLRDIVSKRFPLVPRHQPICRALPDRVARVRDLATQATAGDLGKAAEAHNFAALVLSDCGLHQQAGDLCRAQFALFGDAGPLDVAGTKLALQPLINGARLLLRIGNAAAAYQVLDNLFYSVVARDDITIDGRTVSFGRLIAVDAHREIVQWLWTILLADGSRALVRAGRWHDALDHVERYHGVGERLLDGRQVAVLAHCATGDLATARDLLKTTVPEEPWERVVAACLTVVCDTWTGKADLTAIDAMTDFYWRSDDQPAAFDVRLGLTVIGLASDRRDLRQLGMMVVSTAIESADAYPAHDILTAEPPLPGTLGGARTLIATATAAGLDAGSMPAHLLDDLSRSVKTSSAAIIDTLS